MWLHDQFNARFDLLVIWSGVDRVGPLAVMDLLFTAYNLSALPREIDPFHVQVRSAKEQMSHDLMSIAAQDKIGVEGYLGLFTSIFSDVDSVRSNSEMTSYMQRNAQYYYRKDWIFHLETKPRKSLAASRDWTRFSQNVTSLAA
ncbi:hypothetical protein ACSV5N_01500 [Agrobacterium salinitolerans]|uniref:hypothetical protein n=1 Tax=Agrobacterium salinitolerans TaxID=1183413 RepID=UPI003FD385D2